MTSERTSLWKFRPTTEREWLDWIMGDTSSAFEDEPFPDFVYEEAA